MPDFFEASKKQGFQTVDPVKTALSDDRSERSVANASPSFMLPPPQVLWAWLSYVYECTGEWLMPPTIRAVKSQTSQITKTDSVSGVSSHHEQFLGKASATPENATTATPLYAYQFPIPSMIPYAPVATDDNNKHQIRSSTKSSTFSISNFTTNFNYVKSAYFLEAEKLINACSSRPVKPELSFGCKLVLALIIAWCHFPLFKGTSNRKGQWMTLAFERCARELKIRATYFKICLAELEEMGLLKVGSVKDGVISRSEYEQLRYDCATAINSDSTSEYTGYWKTRAIQEKTLIYCLKPVEHLSPSLPLFDPITSSKLQGRTQEGLEITSSELLPAQEVFPDQIVVPELFGKDFKATIKAREALPKSFLINTCNDLNHDDDYEGSKTENEKLKPEEEDKKFLKVSGSQASTASRSLKTGDFSPLSEEVTQFDLTTNSPANSLVAANLEPKQKAVFDFLNYQASFPNFSRKDGRTTLDSREALKFALNSSLSLEQVIERYQQVKEMWLNGSCRKSPLGLLHWSLVNDCDPRSSDSQSSSQLFLQQLQRESEYQHNFTRSQTAIPASGQFFPDVSSEQDEEATALSSECEVELEAGSRKELKESDQAGQQKSRSFYNSNIKAGKHWSGSSSSSNNNNNTNTPLNNRRISSNSRSSNNRRNQSRPKASWKAVSQPFSQELSGDNFSSTTSQEDNLLPAVVPKTPDLVDPDKLWEKVMDDLESRFRLGTEQLKLLESSRLQLPDAATPTAKELGCVVIILRTVFEQNQLKLASKGTIEVALRQHFNLFEQLEFRAF